MGAAPLFIEKIHRLCPGLVAIHVFLSTVIFPELGCGVCIEDISRLDNFSESVLCML